MLEDLHDMLQKDPDAQVVANCMSVLLEVGTGAKLCQSSMRQLPWDACCCWTPQAPVCLCRLAQVRA